MRAIPQLVSAPLNPHTAISEEMFSVKSFIKLIAQTTKTYLTFHCHKSRIYKKLQTLPIIWEISDSNLATGRTDDFDPLTVDFRSEFLQVLGIRQFCIFSLSP